MSATAPSSEAGWYLILRTPIGIALALLFYLVLRGGLIAPTLSTTPADPTPKSHAWTLLNPYGLAAIAAMAGMFSKQATDKLSELFDTLFKTTAVRFMLSSSLARVAASRGAAVFAVASGG